MVVFNIYRICHIINKIFPCKDILLGYILMIYGSKKQTISGMLEFKTSYIYNL